MADVILNKSGPIFVININININIIKIYVITCIDVSDIISLNNRFGYLCLGLWCSGAFLTFCKMLRIEFGAAPGANDWSTIKVIKAHTTR